MNITIYTVGKIKEKFYRQAIEEYEKRLGRYCKLKIVEVSDEKTPDHASDTETRQIKDKEGERLLRQIKDGTYLIALAIQGKKLDSVAVINRADYLLSFSDMTFPHQLMRVILLEQVYRAYRIMSNEPYHK